MNKEELLKILSGYKWIKVKQPDFDGCDNTREEFDMLDKHHIEETEFLINKCRELAAELLNQQSPSDDEILEAANEELNNTYGTDWDDLEGIFVNAVKWAKDWKPNEN